MSLIQSLNKFLRDANRKAELAVRKKQAQNERARTKGYNNNNNFRAKSASSNRDDTTFAYNAGIPKNKKVMIDDLDVISSQSVQKKQEVEDYEELDKNYNYEYFQISRRDGFCAILRIGVLNKSRSESLREKNKRIKANKKSSGSSNKDNYIAHLVVLTYGAAWEPEIETSGDESKLVSLNFNEANWWKLFAPGIRDILYDYSPNFSEDMYQGLDFGSYTSVRFWEKSSVMANGIYGSLDGAFNSGEGMYDLWAGQYSYLERYGRQYPHLYSVPDLYIGVCDFESIRSGLSSDTKFTVSGPSHSKLFTASGPAREWGDSSIDYYDNFSLDGRASYSQQISYGAPFVIDRRLLSYDEGAASLGVDAVGNPIPAGRYGSFWVGWPFAFHPIPFSSRPGIGDKTDYFGYGRRKTNLAVILDGTSSVEYLADQAVQYNQYVMGSKFDPGNYDSRVFVLPDSSAEVQGEQLWLNYYSVLNQRLQSHTETNTLIWKGWNHPERLFSVPSNLDGSQARTLMGSNKIHYVIEDNSRNINGQKLCKWCVTTTTEKNITHQWMAGDLSNFMADPLSNTSEVKRLEHPSNELYFIDDGTNILGHTFYSDLTGGLLPLLRYAESSYTLSDETKLTVKLSQEGDLFLCKMNPDKPLSSSIFDPLTNNGTVPKLIPFTSQNIADKIGLPDTPYFPDGYFFFPKTPLVIQTIPSSARSIATMYFNPKNSKLTASLGVVPLGVANLDLATDDSPITLDNTLGTNGSSLGWVYWLIF